MDDMANMKIIELDPDNRPWEYNGSGLKVWKNTGWTRVWSDSDQKKYEESVKK